MNFTFSDDEDEGMDVNTACNFKLRFGKHKGEAIGSVAGSRDGRSYLKYLLGWSELREETRMPIQVVLDEYQRQRNAQ
jgi:hypothetical protein